VRAVDHGVGRAAEFRVGARHNTLVIVTATHGYEWMDRGWIGDAPGTRLVRVPFIARVPGVKPTRRVIDEPVSVTALAPTVLMLLGIDIGPIKFDSAPLRRAAPTTVAAALRVISGGGIRSRGARHCVGNKLVRRPHGRGRLRPRSIRRRRSISRPASVKLSARCWPSRQRPLAAVAASTSTSSASSSLRR
jgi:hypothetical protein